MREMKVNLELERRGGSGKIRIVIIKPQFVDISLGVNFTFKNKTLYNSWNMYINIFYIKYIIRFIFNDPIINKISPRERDENVEYIMGD